MLRTLLPNVEDPAARRRIAHDHLTKSLRRARRFQAALDVPASPPEDIDLILIAGDSKPTLARMAVD